MYVTIYEQSKTACCQKHEINCFAGIRQSADSAGRGTD